MTQITRNELSEHLVETLNRLAADGDPVLVEDVAVIMSAGEYKLLRELEDRLDLAAMAGAKAASEGVVAYEATRRELGL